MTTTDATRCATCGGPFSSKRVIIDGAAFHEHCSLMSRGSHTYEDVMWLSTKIREAYTAGYWRWAGPANEAEIDDAFKDEQQGWAEWSAEHLSR